jgi:HEAT repeat protein
MTGFFLAVQLFALACAVLFCVVGYGYTSVRRSRDRRRVLAYDLAARVVLDSAAESEVASEELAEMPLAVVADVLQQLATDVNGEARRRLRLVAIQAGLVRRIERWSRHPRWHRRAQAAHLLVLLGEDAPERSSLLHDSHPLVRARAIESMSPDEIGAQSAALLEAFDHESPAVQAAAQYALVRGGVDCVVPVVGLLHRLDRGAHDPRAIVLAAEVAAQIPDSRIVDALLTFASHPDERLRLLVATCLGNGTFVDQTSELGALLVDDEAAVRAEAARSVGRAQVVALAHRVGVALSDRSWQVRRNAGAALLDLGPIGKVVLRCHLNDEDPFARDMALHVLGRDSRLTDVLGNGNRWMAA